MDVKLVLSVYVAEYRKRVFKSRMLMKIFQPTLEVVIRGCRKSFLR
jgi:hypothetical protein